MAQVDFIPAQNAIQCFTLGQQSVTIAVSVALGVIMRVSAFISSLCSTLLPTMLLAIFVLGLPAADDLERLLVAAPLPSTYANLKPAFAASKETFVQSTATGETNKEFWIVRDHGKAVAVLNEGDCQLDWITPRPDQVTEELHLPRVYSWVSLLGCRISTVAWIDGQGPSGDTRTHTFNAGGDTITLTVAETWTKKRQGSSTYTFTLRVDPTLGYVWDIKTLLKVDHLEMKKEKQIRDVELLNVQPGRLSDPWPDRWRYDRTVVSPPGEIGFLGFSNNLVAGDRSDNNGRLKMRDGGLTAFIADADGWGIALVRGAGGTAEQAPNSTCNVWLDQHNKLLFPEKPNAEGLHVIDASWKWVGLPPQTVAEISKQTKIIDFGEKNVMVRLGIPENFDDQPLSMDTPQRGLWTWGLEVGGEHVRSGTKALRLKGVEKIDGNTGRFIAPFVPLDSAATYQLSAWVWVEGGANATFFICSGEPKLEVGPMRSRSTNRVGPKAEWQEVSWKITGRGNIDPRLVLIGKDAKAWVDDFSLIKLP